MPSHFGMIERTLDHIRPFYIICNLIIMSVHFFFNKHECLPYFWRCGDCTKNTPLQFNMRKTKNHQTLSCIQKSSRVNMCSFRDEWIRIQQTEWYYTFPGRCFLFADRHESIGQWTGHVTENPKYSKPRTCFRTTSCLRFQCTRYVRVIYWRLAELAQNQIKKPKHETAVYHRCHHCRHTNQRGVY